MITLKKTILIDLDGVLNTYNGIYQKDFIPPIREGTKDFIKKLHKEFEIILFTTRKKDIASVWIMENELNDYILEITDIKKPAYLLIDDRCLNFNGNYQDLLLKIKNFKPWYKL